MSNLCLMVNLVETPGPHWHEGSDSRSLERQSEVKLALFSPFKYKSPTTVLKEFFNILGNLLSFNSEVGKLMLLESHV